MPIDKKRTQITNRDLSSFLLFNIETLTLVFLPFSNAEIQIKAD